LTARFAAALANTRDPMFTQQNLLSMVRSRTSGVLTEQFLVRLSSSWPRLDELFHIDTRTQLAHDTGRPAAPSRCLEPVRRSDIPGGGGARAPISEPIAAHSHPQPITPQHESSG
jgi:hypothetical protein